MIAIENTIISKSIKEIYFCCDLKKCKGACCVEGDAGAPLEEDEISILEDEIKNILPFMMEKGKEIIEKNGVFDYDEFGNYVTPLINDRECAYVIFENDIAFCAIEKAYNLNKISFRKPVSCQLYPIRITKYKDFDAVNYHKWFICEKALVNGKREKITLYKFVKDALIRKFGKKWYEELDK